VFAGYDVSHYQSLAEVAAVCRAGAAYVFVKTSEGLDTDNPGGTPAHDIDVATIRAHGVTVGHYHFARDVHAATAEADHFLALAKARPGDLLALDIEAMNGTWPERVAYVVAWLTRVHGATGADPFRYFNQSWGNGLAAAATPAEAATMAAFPEWIATGGLPAGQPGVRGWVVQQWTTAGGIDHDVNPTSLAPYAIPGEDVSLATDTTAPKVIEDAVLTAPIGRTGLNLAQVLQDIYQATAAPAPAVDPAALAAALAPLLHPQVDATALAGALAPLVGPAVIAALIAHLHP
jgi:hypothetical protein